MRKIFIDPSHGGKDPGVVGPSGIKEKDLAMQMADLFSMACRRKGWDVQWSRYTDINVSELGSTQKANDWNADVYVALHINGADNPKAQGYEVLYWHTSKKGKELAENIVERMEEELPTRTNRGAKSRTAVNRGATVLSKTKMPSIIIEPGFVSNSVEEIWLQRFSVQATIVETITEAIESCLFKGGNTNNV